MMNQLKHALAFVCGNLYALTWYVSTIDMSFRSLVYGLLIIESIVILLIIITFFVDNWKK